MDTHSLLVHYCVSHPRRVAGDAYIGISVCTGTRFLGARSRRGAMYQPDICVVLSREYKHIDGLDNLHYTHTSDIFLEIT
jgi:hypothetical protein